IYVFDPTVNDPLSKVRGVGRYLQILKENFGKTWIFTNDLSAMEQSNNETIFINPFFNFLQYPLTMRRIAKKQVAVIHDLIPLKYPEHFPIGVRGKLNIFLNKLALKNYDLIITDSETSKDDIMKILRMDENKIKVIYPCLPKIFSISKPQIPITNQAPIPNEKNKKIFGNWKLEIGNSFCLYVGDATWNKNLVNLAKTIKIINVTCVFVGKTFEILKPVQDDKIDRTSEVEEDPDVTSGDGKTSEVKFENAWQKELKEFNKETRGDKRFIFLGYVPDEELILLYQKARCNLLVSRDEGFGFSYLEAASQACPSVLSNTQVLHEISINQGALFANPDNPNEIANTIGEVYFNNEVRSKLGIEAKRRTKYFNNKKFISDFYKVLNFNI
ncbi:glycosyltransferase family 4 protein, partial [Candidatus Roizmanbacteria bacterium]|nr:glycosyltransferase family 4 protein [Candidatus Roizmanbacteria bacterium]